jgi:hypothetical protein
MKGKNMKTNKFFTLLLVLALTAMLTSTALADEPTYTEVWDGRGADSEHCEYVGQDGRPETGWIHWVFNTKGDSTDASLVLGGTGSGTYSPGEPLQANIWHFYTPYFDLDGLTATIYLYGGAEGDGGGLVISDYCPGVDYEELTVSKTVVTSFTREHFWDIDKSVDTENGNEHEGYPKVWLYIDGSGDETATWTVDVTYEDYVDSLFNVSGVITIENTGTLNAVITDITDVLAGTSITVTCDGDFNLAVGETLTCTYDEDVLSKIVGNNVVTVTTERDTYDDTKAIVWGAPTTEINATVTVKDLSDLFDEVELGKVTAPNDAQFTYTKDFAWVDYGEDNCGDFTYENTATIVETEQSASATLKVNVQCYIYETAYAMGDPAICFIPTFSQWGWTNPITQGTYEWELWAGAAQCDTTKGTHVGSVTVVYDNDGYVTVTYNVAAPYLLKETHVYAGTTMFPKVKVGKKLADTVAPGQYTNNSPFLGGPVYVIAHAVVGIPDPNFGP